MINVKIDLKENFWNYNPIPFATSFPLSKDIGSSEKS